MAVCRQKDKTGQDREGPITLALWRPHFSVPSSRCAGVADHLSNHPLNASLLHNVYLRTDNEIVDKSLCELWGVAILAWTTRQKACRDVSCRQG